MALNSNPEGEASRTKGPHSTTWHGLQCHICRVARVAIVLSAQCCGSRFCFNLSFTGARFISTLQQQREVVLLALSPHLHVPRIVEADGRAPDHPVEACGATASAHA